VSAVPASAPYPRLLGDVGGTGARFAWVADAGAPLVALAPAAGPPAVSIDAEIRSVLEASRLPLPQGPLRLRFRQTIRDITSIAPNSSTLWPALFLLLTFASAIAAPI